LQVLRTVAGRKQVLVASLCCLATLFLCSHLLVDISKLKLLAVMKENNLGEGLAYTPKVTNTEALVISRFLSQYPNVTGAETKEFMAYKELQYSGRRDRIQKHCASSQFGNAIINNTLVYDPQDQVAYCMIAKAASSTWCTHFINLANPVESIRTRYRNALQLLAPKLFPAPADPVRLVQGWQQTTSIVIVRHPLARLASVYKQKFVNLASHKSWGAINKRVIRKYRKVASNETIPSPDEMVRYVVANLKSGLRQDQHWRHQHQSCPFCLLNFSIYARVEELGEDTLYFILKAGLSDKLNPDIKMNPTKHSDKEFWSLVDAATVAELVGLYSVDFRLFGYSARDYLRSLDVPVNEKLIGL